jgi:hypothetical protein
VGTLPEKSVMHLDSGYDGKPSRTVLANHGLVGEIAKKGIPSPIQVGKRWVVERTHSWMNNFGKLRRCTDRDGTIVDFYLYLAAAFVTLRCLIRKARQTHRWDSRPTNGRRDRPGDRGCAERTDPRIPAQHKGAIPVRLRVSPQRGEQLPGRGQQRGSVAFRACRA